MATDAFLSDPLHGPDDLARLWRHLLADAPPGPRTLWFALVDASGRPTRFVTSVGDLPDVVEPVGLDNLLWICASIVADHDGSRVTLCLQREGRARPEPSDRAWSAAVAAAARRHRVTAAPLFLAVRGEVMPI